MVEEWKDGKLLPSYIPIFLNLKIQKKVERIKPEIHETIRN